MPTRKQRKRQQKLRRHEWEEVWVDEEGREVEVAEPADERARPDRGRERDRKQQPAKGKGGARSRSGRVPQPPSWERVGKRAAMFAPLMYILVYYVLEKKTNRSVTQALLTTAVLMAFFVPFSYVMDSVMYRSYRKRMGLDKDAPRKKR